MYRKFRNVPIFEDFSPICPYFLGFRVGKYAICDVLKECALEKKKWPCPKNYKNLRLEIW